MHRASIVCAWGALALLVGSAGAQQICDKKDCKAELTSTGGVRPTTDWAKSSARTSWQKEVKSSLGEQYQEVECAKAGAQYRCSSVAAGMKRCTVRAVPCRVAEDPGKGDLTGDEIKEMQRLLNVSADGNFGEKSRNALKAWQKKKGVTQDGAPSRANLQALKK